MARDPSFLRIVRLARHAERRTRLVRALRVGARALAVALVVAVGVVAARKLGFVGDRFVRQCLGATGLSLMIAVLTAWRWRLAEHAGAHAIDRHYELHDRLTSALAFSERPPDQRSLMMQAAIDDAARAAVPLRAAAAVPLRVPRELGVCAALGLALFAVARLQEPHRMPPPVRAQTLSPVEASPDDLDDVKDFLAQLAPRSGDPQVKAAIEQLNQLVTDIADKRVDRAEVFRRLDALDAKLSTRSPAEREARARDLHALGDELKKADLSREAGAALKNDDLAQARDALRSLAQRMRENPASIDKAKLERLRESFREASKLGEQRRVGLERRRQHLREEVDRLQRRAKDGGGGDDEEREMLQRDREELQRLDRDLGDANRQSEALDRLDRELEQLAEDLLKDLGESAKDLEDAAEDLNQMNQEEMSQQEKEQLRQRLQELRELLREQGSAGKSRILRLRRFSRIAHGRGDGPSQGGGEGEGDGQGQGGEGKQGSGESKDGQMWVLGPNGEKILLLSQGSRSSSGGPGREGRGAGEGHDPNVQGTPTQNKGSTVDTQVQGAETGQGGSRSEAILGGAERGFASRGYRKVFAEYHQVAEEAVGRDQIPGGYRFYVKRYFELIRPRDAQ